MEAEIRKAFSGVTREGGISWSEADAMDAYAMPAERAAARARDTENRWEELVDDPRWRDDLGAGGFSFLDPIGYRYYLAPVMIRCARRGYSDLLPSPLVLTKAHAKKGVELLTPEQAAAVARFIRLMLETADEHDAGEWREAYESGWCNLARMSAGE